MEYAMWIYPWDLIDEGVQAVADRMLDIGVTELNLATNYHHVQAFTPHNPERRTFFARASSYFQPSDRYEKLAPVPNETMGDADWTGLIAERLAETGVSLNAWTVGVHNSRLGFAHPDQTIETAFGDHLVFGLCPSKPAVQAYLTNLVADLSERGVFERIELETFDYFYGTGFGWHHQKFHARLGTLGEFLFGLCFCEDCRANAADAGVDVQRAQSIVRKTIDGIVADEIPHDASVGAWLRSHPAVADYADVRCETLTSLYSDLNEAATTADLGYYAGLVGVGQSWMQGCDLHALAEHVDYYTVPTYESSPKSVVDRFTEADALCPDIPLHGGLLPGHPAVEDGETLAAMVSGLVDAGASRLSFYNYGLLPVRSFDWIETAIRTVEEDGLAGMK